MTRFADPARCPDCRSALTPGSFVCPSCSLDLSGDLGRRLFTLLTDADQVLLQMRARSRTYAGERVPVGATAGPPAPPAPSPSSPPSATPGALPSMSPSGPPARRESVSSLTVPRILLGLGALTLLVAIVLFFAVAWDALGPGGRTVVLLGLTAAFGATTVAVAQRDLRAATESLGLVALGLLAGDVWGARDAGWISPGSGAQYALVLGSVLAVAGTVSAMALTRTRAGRLLSGEVVAAVGGAILAGGVAGSTWGSAASRLVVAVPLLAILVVLSRLLGQLLPTAQSDPDLVPVEDLAEAGRSARRRLLPMQAETAGLAVVTLVTWLGLAVAALDRVGDDLSLAGVWSGSGLPLLACGTYAALTALLPGPRTARVWALAVAVLPWTVLVTAPAFDESGTVLALVMAVLTLVLAVVLALGPLPWVRAVGTALLVSVPVLLAHSLALLAAGLAAYAEAVRQGWAGSPGGRLDPRTAGLDAPWVLPVAVLVLVAAGFATHRAATGVRPTAHRLHLAAETSLIAAAHGALLVVPSPVVLLLALMLATTLRIGIDGLRGHRRMPAERAAWSVVGLGALALALSAYDEWLTLLACVVLGALAVVHHRSTALGGWAAWGGGLVLGPLGAGAVWAATALLEAPAPWSALVVLLVLGAWVILRGPADDAPVHDGSSWREPVVGVEVGTVVAAGVATVLGSGLARVDQQATWLAVHLTVLGVVAAIVSLTREDRRRVAGWSAFVLLTAASWVRLADLGVHQPEAYTLPSALVLLVVGTHHLRQHPTAGTMRAWSSGLGLALVPSLLWVLADPVSARALLLGLACLGLLLAGTQQRWAAPFVWGSAVGTVLVLRMAAPVALLVGPFLVFALGGVLLLAVGATWEQRLRDAERLRRYVGGLR